MTNQDIATRAKMLGLGRGDLIIADSAEPKSIAELHNSGLYVVPSVKGADSIAVGLDILRRYMIHFTRRSVGIIGNAKSYQWKRDRDGKSTNDPQDGNDHGIDAVRYAALMKLNTRRQGCARAKIGRF
jgi:phage terminase large subunit